MKGNLERIIKEVNPDLFDVKEWVPLWGLAQAYLNVRNDKPGVFAFGIKSELNSEKRQKEIKILKGWVFYQVGTSSTTIVLYDYLQQFL